MANISINLDSLNPKTFKKTVRHKVQDGDNIFRLLPPFGPEANGYPYQKWNVIWGLVDPNSGRMRPFASPSTYEGRCPVYDYLDVLKPKVEELKNTISEERLDELNKFISNLRPKSVFAYNASDKSGQVGVLELKSTAHKKVIALMNKYITDYNQDPTSLNSELTDSGVWFNITRTGKGFDTTYDANKHQTMVKDANGIPSFQDDRTALAEGISQNYEELAYDLNNIYQKLSYDELKDILIANLINASETLPELLISGFGLEEAGNDTIQGNIQSNEVVNSVNNQAPAVNVPQGTGKININLGETNTGGDATSVPAGTVVNTTGTDDTDDLLAMADDIFNS
jgi:hypothetical protein